MLWMQQFMCSGTVKFTIQYEFQSGLKTLYDRFTTARTSGESTAFTVQTAAGATYSYTGTWRYTDTSLRWTGSNSGTGFSTDDGLWMAGTGEVNGDSSALPGSAWGHGNLNSGDSTCGTLYENGAGVSCSGLKSLLYCSTEGASPPPPVPPPRPPPPPSPPTSPPPPPGFYVRIFENTAYVDTSGESANMKSALSAASDVIVSSFTSMTDSSQWSSSTVVLPEFERGVPSLDMTVATAARNFVSSGGVYIIACTPLHISRVDHVVRPALPFGPCSSSATLIDRHSCALCPLSPPEQMHLGRRVLSTPSFRSPCPRAATALQQRRQAAGRA